MKTVTLQSLGAQQQRYAKVIAASKRIRWDIDTDVLRGRRMDLTHKFMPDGLSLVNRVAFLRPAEVRLVSQIQGRTYANMFAMIERCITAKLLDLGRQHALGDPVALEALVRFTDEELKHQELFRRLELMAAEVMPEGYSFRPKPDKVAATVLGKSTWAMLALTLDFEIVSQAHYRSSIEPDASLSDLWKDVLLFHWKEESQHAILDEMEWRQEDARITSAQRDVAVDEFVSLLGSIDMVLQAQATADGAYFIRAADRPFTGIEQAAILDLMLRAYRWQYIVTGWQEPRFMEAMKSLVSPAQFSRIADAVAPIAAHVVG